ncbi:hypothetical protein ACFWNT_41805 [Streptomyces sp. NPDC058409]|uniref:DUF1281 family ferredoxin-like fold protein n=1 Tax=Streptomyces sp. NPDC058409 TaxID=3346484 RepID=UPI0036569E67
MPNHITTKITGPAGILGALTRRHTETERLAHDAAEAKRKQFQIEHGRADDYAYRPLDMDKVFLDFAMLVPQPENIETEGCSGSHDEGVVCWYRWNVDNWGTKWNGYELSIEQADDDSAQLPFDTAWSHPFPIVKALSRKYPDALIEVSYADEDLGHNLGQYVIAAGEILQENRLVPGSDDACEFAAQLKYAMSYAQLRAE